MGVLVLLTTGVVSAADLVGSFQILWRPFVAVLSIMLTTNVALPSPGCLGLGRGQSLQLVFCFVFVFSAATSALLNNDAAVLLLTPLIVDW
jgi:Na+/H+ antiporter NhaD/arsenite permease-like protein